MFVSSLTNGKQLNPSISQALCRRYDIILGLPVCNEDSDFRYTHTGARLGLEAVLQNIGQRKGWQEKEGGIEEG